MKTKLLITTCLFFICIIGTAQKKENTSNENIQKQIDETGNFNLLDGGANVLGDVLGNMGGVEEMQGIESYQDLLAKSNLTTTQKNELMEQYKLIELSLDPEKKKEQQVKFNQMLQKALKEGQTKDN